MGLISMPSQHDGTVRSYQLLSTTGEEQGASWLANFPFYMLTDALGLGDEELEVRDDGIHALNQLFVPLDQRASFRINWAGEQDPIRYISFFKVVHEMVPAEFFEGKFVFFGTSASGMQDLKTVPSRIDKMPGVEVHVHAFLTMANEAWIKEVSNREARPWFLIIAIILAGLMLVMRPLFGFVTTVVLAVAEMLAFVLYVLPERSMVFPIVSLMIITLLTHVFSALYIYFVRERNVRKLRNAFAAYVPKEVVRKIAADTRAVKLGGQRMHLTVLFSDIRGFTSYSESLAPEEVVSFLNDYLSRMSEAIFSNRGTIDKFIGDAVMAIFGAPISQRDHANRACSAGLDMVAALEAFNEVLRQEKKPPVAMGAGINTGDMTVGNIGSRQRFNYTVIGDSVNVAARLESLTKFFGVTLICSAATREACEPDHFVFRPLGRVRLQGRSGHTEIFELCGTADHVVLSYDSTEWSAIIDAVNARDLNGALHRLIVFRERHPNDLPSLRMYELCVLVRDTGDEPVFTPGK